MNKREITGITISAVIILISAIAATIYYTNSNLEMMWLFLFLAVPVLSLIFGLLTGFIFKIIFKFSSQIFLYLIVFSFASYTVLMTEEAFIGIVRKHYDKRIAVLNKTSDNNMKEVNLGYGKYLYYTSSSDEVFKLNFNYRTGQNITRENIMTMSENWINSQGYVPKLPGKIYVSPGFYRKSGFKLSKTPGSIGVSQKIQDSVLHPDQRDIQIFLDLKYKDGKFIMEEIGRGYTPVN
jgi:hypothetical protein